MNYPKSLLILKKNMERNKSFLIRTIFNVLFLIISIFIIYESIYSGNKDGWLSIPTCVVAWLIIYSPIYSKTRTQKEIDFNINECGDFMCDC